MVKKEVLREIDRVIKSVWLREIKRDYLNGALLYEDSLKCGIYYHLRKKLDRLFRENHLRMYGEYTFPDLKYRADLVIAEIAEDWQQSDSLKASVTDIAAIFELKYTAGTDRATEAWVKKDLEKFKRCLRSGNMDCQFYFGVIYEVECSALSWIDKRGVSPGRWGSGRLTELAAGLINGKMTFEVNSYNGLNE